MPKIVKEGKVYGCVTVWTEMRRLQIGIRGYVLKFTLRILMNCHIELQL